MAIEAPRDIGVDVAISGGGMVGASLALALEQRGFEVAMIDPVPAEAQTATSYDGRACAIAFANARLFRHIGIWPHLADRAGPIVDILVTDGRLGRGVSALSLHFDHREIGEEPLGFMIENRHIRAALAAGIAASRVIGFSGARIAARASDAAGHILTLSTGECLRTRLLVIAEGRGSPLRKDLGFKQIGWTYDQTAIVLTVAHARPHEGIAHEYFLPGGPFAILPLAGDRSSLVWTEKTPDALRILGLSEAAFQVELELRFGSHLGAIVPVGPRFSYPLGVSLSRSYVKPGVALIGDAAHVIHPIAGQGLNLGLKDVAALTDVLEEARRIGRDVGALDVLEDYERWRRFDTVSLAVATDGFNRLFSNDIGPVRLARDLGLGIVNEIAPLRRFFMRHAGGAVGDLPSLLRG